MEVSVHFWRLGRFSDWGTGRGRVATRMSLRTPGAELMNLGGVLEVA